MNAVVLCMRRPHHGLGGDGSNGGVPDERWDDGPLLTVAFTAFTAVAVVVVLAAEARDRVVRVVRMIRLIARPR